jgi:serine/threonine-protein kinase
VVVEHFGPYRLEEMIGRGGMGEVFRAYDTVKKRTVALKRLPTALARDDQFRVRFRREAEIAARLSEPHIIPIHDFGEIDGRLFIDMRLVRGANLATLIAQDGPLSPLRAVNIVAQVARALSAAHGEDLVHRDVKPSNILISDQGRGGDFAYLVDFGIARTSTATALTATGATVGTLDYMAPERLLKGLCDHRADIYALGCLLYEALSATKPFPGEGLEVQMYAHVHTPPPKPSMGRAHLPDGLDEVVARAMAKVPDHRFPSASDFADAALATLIPLPATTPATASVSPTNPPTTTGTTTRPSVTPTPAPTTRVPGLASDRTEAQTNVPAVQPVSGTPRADRLGHSIPSKPNRLAKFTSFVKQRPAAVMVVLALIAGSAVLMASGISLGTGQATQSPAPETGVVPTGQVPPPTTPSAAQDSDTKMPDVRYLTAHDAIKSLRSVGFSGDVQFTKTSVSNPSFTDVVVSQSVAPGQDLDPAGSVQLAIGQYPGG